MPSRLVLKYRVIVAKLGALYRDALLYMYLILYISICSICVVEGRHNQGISTRLTDLLHHDGVADENESERQVYAGTHVYPTVHVTQRSHRFVVHVRQQTCTEHRALKSRLQILTLLYDNSDNYVFHKQCPFRRSSTRRPCISVVAYDRGKLLHFTTAWRLGPTEIQYSLKYSYSTYSECSLNRLFSITIFIRRSAYKYNAYAVNH